MWSGTATSFVKAPLILICKRFKLMPYIVRILISKKLLFEWPYKDLLVAMNCY